MALWLAAALLAAACARVPVVAPRAASPDPELIVVVPGPDGKVGAVTVTQGSEEHTLDRAYAAARISGPGQIQTGQATDAEIQAIFGTALASLPPRPVAFVLFFVFGGDALTPESTAMLAAIVGEVKGRPVAEVIAIGHTDRVGSDQQNDALSRQRAERVRQELIRMGIEPDRIVAVGRGEREPLVATEDEVPHPRNRRVEITVR